MTYPQQQQPYDQYGAAHQAERMRHLAEPPRRRRRVFPWVFLAVQLLFLAWVIAGAASGGSIHSDAWSYCHAHPDPYVPFSQCVTDYGSGAKVGTGIGIALILVLWAVADIILGFSYVVWRLARR